MDTISNANSVSGPNNYNATTDSLSGCRLPRRQIFASLVLALACFERGDLTKVAEIDWAKNVNNSSVLKQEDTKSEDLKKVKDRLEKLNSGLKILSAGAFIQALRQPGTAWEEVSDSLERIESLGDTATEAVGKLIDALEEDDEEGAKELAKEISIELKDLINPESYYIKQLKILRQEIENLEVGLVSEKSDPQFTVTFELLKQDKQEAFKRFRALAEAMEKNIEMMEKRKNILEDVADQSAPSAKGLTILSEALVELEGTGFFGIVKSMLLLRALDMDNLAKLCNGTGHAAKRKAVELERAIEVETDRLDCLKTNLKTFFELDLDAAHLSSILRIRWSCSSRAAA